MYGRSRVSVKVEGGLTSTFTRGVSYIASISFMHVKFTCVRTEKLRDSANQPLLSRARRKTQSNTKRERRAQWARPTKGKVTSYRVFRLVFLSYLIFSLLSTWLPRSIPAFHCLFVCIFFGRDLEAPRGTLIAAATGKLRINLSFRLAPTLCQSNVQIFRPHKTSESNHWNSNLLKPVSSKGQFNKTFTSVIYKCSYLFSDSKTMATLVNYTCKSFIKLAPDKFKAPSTRIRVKKNVRIRRVDGAKTWLWLNWFGRIIAVLIYKENKIETGLIKRRFYLYFCFQEWSIWHIYNKILFLNSLRSGRLEVVGTRKNGRVCAHYFQASATQATSSKTHSAQPAS